MWPGHTKGGICPTGAERGRNGRSRRPPLWCTLTDRVPTKDSEGEDRVRFTRGNAHGQQCEGQIAGRGEMIWEVLAVSG